MKDETKSLTRTVQKKTILSYIVIEVTGGESFEELSSQGYLKTTTVKLKEYIEILSQFDPEVEVLRKSRSKHNMKCLVELDKRDIIPPHPHFKYDLKSGKDSLVDSYIV